MFKLKFNGLNSPFRISSGNLGYARVPTSHQKLTPDIGDYYSHIRQDDGKILSTHNMSITLKNFDYGRRNRLRSFLVEERFWQLPDGDDGIICTYMEIANLYFSTFMMPR